MCETIFQETVVGHGAVGPRQKAMSDEPDHPVTSTAPSAPSVFERLFEHTPDAVLVVDAENDRITECNDRACELLGYDRDRLLSLGPSDIHPHEHEEFREFAASVDENGHGFTTGLSCYTRDGTVVPVEVTATTVAVGGRSQLLAIVRDVSERLDRRRALRRRSAAMAAATDGIAVLADDGTVELANAAYASLFGYEDADDVVGERWDALHATPDRFELDCRPTVESSGEWIGELTAPRADAPDVPVRASLMGLETGEFVCVARDVADEKRHEKRLTGLAEASRDLLSTTDAESVGRVAIGTVADVLGYELGCIRRYDADGNELVRTATTDAAAELVRTEVAYDLKASNAGAAYRAGETVRNESSTDDAYADGPCRAEVHVPLGEFGVLSVFDDDGRFDDRDVQLVELFAGIVRTAFSRAERERRLRSQRAELERRRDELSATDRFNTLVTEVIRSVLRATSGADVKETVCETLSGSPLYEAAWVATVDGDDDGGREDVLVNTRSTSSGAFAEVDPAAFVGSSFARQLVRKAEDTDGIVVERRRFETRDDGSADRDPDASVRDDGAIAAAVPIACGRQRFGVLAVAGTGENGFGEATQGGLELLAETLGFASIADRRRATLIEGDSVEVEFALDSPLADLSAAFDCRCDLLGRDPDAADGHAYEIRISHGDFDGIREFLATTSVIRDCELVERRDGASVVRIVVDGAPPKLLAEAGFSLESMYAADGESRLVAEVPNDEDVSRVLAALRNHWDGVRLVAKRQTPTRRSRVPIPDDAGLTDRQRSVLETAYGMGYYDWPREHTAEEVAESLDIASATLHQHLRAAEHALVSAFVSDE